jgi:hypothetical protein
MTFSDLFRPVSALADSADNRNPTFLTRAKNTIRESDLPVGKKSGFALSALSAAPAGGILVPLETPWIDGKRYRLAGATEARTRLDLYVADPAGPWIRRHGVLIAVNAPR